MIVLLRGFNNQSLRDNVKDITLSIPWTFPREERNISDEELDLDSDEYNQEEGQRTRMCDIDSEGEWHS